MKRVEIKKHSAFAEKILSAYEKNIFYLSPAKTGHFFTRAYRTTGNEKYTNVIANSFFINRLERIRKSVEKMKKNDFENSTQRKKTSKKDIRNLKRAALYKKLPEVDFFNTLVMDLFYCKIHFLDKTALKNEYKEATVLLKKINFKKIYLKESIVKLDSSYAFNTALLLKHLGISNFSGEIEKLLMKTYFDNKMKLNKVIDKYEFRSLIYSMTHIIIADSKFYEKYVSGHEWIINFFEKNIDTIKTKTTLDILSEVGLCIRLCKKENEYSETYDEIRRYLYKKVASKKLTKNYLLKNEHTNSILMLLFTQNNKLHGGPDLSKERVFANY